MVKCGNVIKEKSNQLRWSTKRTKSTIIWCSKCNLYLPSHGCNSPTWSISWPNYSLTSWPESLWLIFQYFGPKNMRPFFTARALLRSKKFPDMVHFQTKLLFNVLTTMYEISKICQNLRCYIWPWSNSLTWSISWSESLRSKIMRPILTTRALPRLIEFVWWCW